MNIEETLKILQGIKEGAEMCLMSEHPKNKEDIEHWKKEINAIEIMVNSYLKEKARADKLEKKNKELKVSQELAERVIDRMTDYMYKELDFAHSKKQVKEYFYKKAEDK